MAGENRAFVAFVHTLKCRMWMQDPCEGPLQAHHAGSRGVGQRAPDDTCIPLCRRHHQAWHDLLPPFRGMSRDERRAWRDAQIEWVRARFKSDDDPTT